MSNRVRAVVAVGAALAVLGFCILWFVSREVGGGSAANFRTPSRWLPTTWPPAVRGSVWLIAGAIAVAFDLTIVRSGAESQRARDIATAFAVVTGIAFAAFAVMSFVNAR